MMLAPAAHASDDDDSPEHEEVRAKPSDRTWYGYQTLLVDAALIGLFASAPAWARFDGAGAILILDAATFAFASPVIHTVHGNGEASAISVGLHAGLPFSGMWIGFVVGMSLPCSCGLDAWFCFCGLSNAGEGAFAGSLVGGALATVIDAAFLAWERHKPKPWSLSWSVAPYAVRGGGGVGASCTF